MPGCTPCTPPVHVHMARLRARTRRIPSPAQPSPTQPSHHHRVAPYGFLCCCCCCSVAFAVDSSTRKYWNLTDWRRISNDVCLKWNIHMCGRRWLCVCGMGEWVGVGAGAGVGVGRFLALVALGSFGLPFGSLKCHQVGGRHSKAQTQIAGH